MEPGSLGFTRISSDPLPRLEGKAFTPYGFNLLRSSLNLRGLFLDMA